MLFPLGRLMCNTRSEPQIRRGAAPDSILPGNETKRVGSFGLCAAGGDGAAGVCPSPEQGPWASRPRTHGWNATVLAGDGPFAEILPPVALGEGT